MYERTKEDEGRLDVVCYNGQRNIGPSAITKTVVHGGIVWTRCCHISLLTRGAVKVHEGTIQYG